MKHQSLDQFRSKGWCVCQSTAPNRLALPPITWPPTCPLKIFSPTRRQSLCFSLVNTNAVKHHQVTISSHVIMTGLSYTRLQPKTKYQEKLGRYVSFACGVVTLNLIAHNKDLQLITISIIAFRCCHVPCVRSRLGVGLDNLPLKTEYFMSTGSKQESATGLS